MNNPNIYRQYDDRWGSLPYPGSGAYLSDSGCGCLAVYHCAIELEKYKNLTVKKCRNYMVQFATVEHGTLWSGMTEGLKHYGYKVHWREADTMSDIFKELKDSCKCGAILFAKKKGPSYGPDGTLWTNIGHYIAFCDYKIEDGQHWFYMKDSGPRKHDKWFSYEKSMKGCVRNVWICKSTKEKGADPTPDPKPTPKSKTYKGNYPNVKLYLEPGDRGENVIRLQQYLDWWSGGAFTDECGSPDGIYGSNTLRWVKKMQKEFFGAKEADGLVGHKTIAKMKEVGGYKEKPSHSGYTVIDISEFQPTKIDFKKVKADGIKGAIVRCGGRGAGTAKLFQDQKFMEHITGAHKAGLKCGIYMFTEAVNATEGKEEARYAIDLLKKSGVPIDYPIAIDSENVYYKENGRTYAGRANSTKLSKAKRTEAIDAFCKEVKRQGYEPMIYASLDWFKNQLNMSKLPYKVWVAQYYSECQYKGDYAFWQYTSEGRVNGIKEVVDLNKCYI